MCCVHNPEQFYRRQLSFWDLGGENAAERDKGEARGYIGLAALHIRTRNTGDASFYRKTIRRTIGLPYTSK